MAERFEYYVRRTGEATFEVSKFPEGDSGGAQPLRVYKVVYTGTRGKCDCPAGMYRGMGMEDKHVKLVQRWIKDGEQLQGYVL